MEFDLKSACSLIPLMDGTEETTKRLIDAVDMYSGMLNETGKKSLITFVLKGRLSESAKLRMSATYTTVEHLIRDLRNSLLPKKSFTAIHSRLQNISQGWRSIDQYGSEIEKLFSELTITQAEGNSASYDVLKPLNEKMCIKKFTDGLKDPRLSTIIAARNFSSLKDAIQAAQDEDISRPTTSSQSEVMGTIEALLTTRTEVIGIVIKGVRDSTPMVDILNPNKATREEVAVDTSHEAGRHEGVHISGPVPEGSPLVAACT
ncbi:uncharacterized protein LOC134657670 [Cydia amplana]|uniref:uncharacterized protein LOC134657670 n=1 Tax=Cydia amplana TaxID=1869771 RepID=UPI002FE67268